ncbi:MAG: hypothetical protein Kow00109_09730 [Acidobacteriota bacterium]
MTGTPSRRTVAVSAVQHFSTAETPVLRAGDLWSAAARQVHCGFVSRPDQRLDGRDASPPASYRSLLWRE